VPGSVFLSYRREDSAGHAGRLYDRLKVRFPGRVFLDVGEISPGTDFVEAIERGVGDCAALVALIGPDWSSDGRLQKGTDFVRLEIATALKRNICVIPALVQGARLPDASDLPDELAPLLRRQAIGIHDEEWDEGCERLIRTLEKVIGPARKRPGAALKWALSLAGVAVALGLVVVVYPSFKPGPIGSPISTVTPEETEAAKKYAKSVEKGYSAATDALDKITKQMQDANPPAEAKLPISSVSESYFEGRWIVRGPNSNVTEMKFAVADHQVSATPSLGLGTWTYANGGLVTFGSGNLKLSLSDISTDHFTGRDSNEAVWDFTRKR
jgi:hypothetical protein